MEVVSITNYEAGRDEMHRMLVLNNRESQQARDTTTERPTI